MITKGEGFAKIVPSTLISIAAAKWKNIGRRLSRYCSELCVCTYLFGLLSILWYTCQKQVAYVPEQ